MWAHKEEQWPNIQQIRVELPFKLNAIPVEANLQKLRNKMSLTGSALYVK
jgi:hypothetical protein